MARTHIVIPDELLRKVDRRAGARGRSRFIVEAVRDRLEQLELERILRRTSGILKADRYPHWKDREAVAEWVRKIRSEPDRPL